MKDELFPCDLPQMGAQQESHGRHSHRDGEMFRPDRAFLIHYFKLPGRCPGLTCLGPSGHEPQAIGQ